jgi:RNA polymerase sigma factor (sigma-70 family)
MIAPEIRYPVHVHLAAPGRRRAAIGASRGSGSLREPFAGFGPIEGVDELVRAAQRGDLAAMDQLVRALSPYVGRICGSIALDDGDDAMQETFIAVLRRLHTLREPAAIRGWVRRIAVREAVRIARRRGPVVEVVEETAPLLDVPQCMDVRDVLARLAPEHRAVLVLRDLDGFSEAETAALLEVPAGTVKSRLHRARLAFAGRWQA